MAVVKRIVIGTAIVAVLAYVMVLGVMYFFQRDFQYDRSGRLFALSETKLTGTEVVTIPSADGSNVTGWYQAPAEGMPVILYFRGNAQSFSREHERFEAWTEAGYGFLAFDYRGFPGSPGDLNETNVLADSLAAYDWLAAKGFPILLWGRSLGSGPATYVASEREAKALLLETPFLSAVSVANERYAYLPVYWLMQDQYRVDEWITRVEEPVFVAHGTADRTISVGNGEKVYELAPNKGGIWIEEGADHSDLWAAGLWMRALKFFDGVVPPDRVGGEAGMKPVPISEIDLRLRGDWMRRLSVNVEPGDEVWRVRSRFIGPLAGWQGVVLVRNGVIIDTIPTLVY